MIQDNLQCNIPSWNTPVIPGNATQGSILITKTDFTTPPNSQELFKWEKMEDLIGVANIKIEFDIIEEPTKATLYKAKGHKDASGNWSYDWESVGTWGMIKAENATKINLIDYVNYTIIVNENTAKLIGTKADGTTEEIGDAILFFGKEEGEELKTQVENLKLDNEGIKNLIAVINLDIDKILENQEKFLTIYNKLIEATSPNLVLSKASDGINLEWVNKLGIDNITCNVNATNSTITIYKIINGVEEELITLDKFDLNSFNNLYDLVNEINRAIGELTATVETFDERINVNTENIENIKTSLNNKQDILTAGENITIENNIISASGGGGEFQFYMLQSAQYHQREGERGVFYKDNENEPFPLLQDENVIVNGNIGVNIKYDGILINDTLKNTTRILEIEDFSNSNIAVFLNRSDSEIKSLNYDVNRVNNIPNKIIINNLEDSDVIEGNIFIYYFLIGEVRYNYN